MALSAEHSVSGSRDSRALLRSLPPRDFLVIVSALGVVTVLAWVYLVDMARDMDAMDMSAMGRMAWTPEYFTAMLIMWVIMMVGMMVPSAIPMVLIYAAIGRKAAREGSSLAPTGFFATGYILVWSIFSVGATIAQWALDRAALLTPMMMSNSAVFGGLLLLGAGLYQLTPVKTACLRHCRSPAQFLAHSWKQGCAGAVRMGLEHGVYCMGCCWILMCLLFFGGVMSIWWIGGLTLYVLLEKVVPFGVLGGRIVGVLAACWGISLLVSTLFP